MSYLKIAFDRRRKCAARATVVWFVSFVCAWAAESAAPESRAFASVPQSFDEKWRHFLANPDNLPYTSLLEGLGSHRDEVLAKVRDLAEPQWRDFEAFTADDRSRPRGTPPYGLWAVTALIAIGDHPSLQRANQLWTSNISLIRWNERFLRMLCDPDQPRIALIIGPDLDLGVGLLETDDKALLEARKDPALDERYIRATSAASLLERAISNDEQISLAARDWFSNESVRFDRWYIMRRGRGNAEARELERMRWLHARQWYLTNKVAISEGRYSDVKAPSEARGSTAPQAEPGRETAGSPESADPPPATPISQVTTPPLEKVVPAKWRQPTRIAIGAIVMAILCFGLIRHFRRRGREVNANNL